MIEYEKTKQKIQKTILKFPREEQNKLSIAFNVLESLIKGPLKNFGMICDVDGKSLRISATELCDAIRFLTSHGYKINRTDCGGSPTWELIP